MSHPEGLPKLFLDRSLGSIKVPDILRAAGLVPVTMTEHYGPAAERIADPEWLELVGYRGWIGLTKDEGIRHQAVNRQALIDNEVRCFYLARQNLVADEMARRFLRNLPAIVRACGRSGPFIYAVHKSRIVEMPISSR